MSSNVRHCQALSGTVRHCEATLVTVRHCQSLLGIVSHCQALLGIVRHCQALSVAVGIVRHCQSLQRLLGSVSPCQATLCQCSSNEQSSNTAIPERLRKAALIGNSHNISSINSAYMPHFSSFQLTSPPSSVYHFVCAIYYCRLYTFPIRCCLISRNLGTCLFTLLPKAQTYFNLLFFLTPIFQAWKVPGQPEFHFFYFSFFSLVSTIHHIFSSSFKRSAKTLPGLKGVSVSGVFLYDWSDFAFSSPYLFEL